MLILTEQMLRAGRSNTKGYSVAQLLALGLRLSPSWRASWRRTLLGKQITEEAYQLFLDLRGRYSDAVRSRNYREQSQHFHNRNM